jgi:Zn-finger nucleic acid-binding protein
MSHCPCCDQILTQEYRQTRLSWFCRGCWQEMPNLEELLLSSRLAHREILQSQLEAAFFSESQEHTVETKQDNAVTPKVNSLKIYKPVMRAIAHSNSPAVA